MRVRRPKVTIAPLLLLALLPFVTFCSVARAAEELEPPDLERFLRWGPVRARPGMDITNVGYDSNIFYATGDREPVADITATLSPKLDGLVLFGDRAFLTFLGQLDFGLYLQNSSLNFINERWKSRITLPSRSKRFGLFADLNFNSVNQRPVDLQDIRPIRDERLFGLGAIIEAGWRSSIEVRQSRSKITYEDPDFDGNGVPIGDRLDRDEDTTQAEFRYRFLGRTKALFDGMWNQIDFRTELPSLDGPVSRDRNEWRLLTGLSFGEGGRLSGFFKLGWDQINAIEPTLPDLSEPVGEMKLAYRAGDRTRLRFDGQRLPGFAVWGLNSYYMLTEVGTRVVHYLNRPLGVEAGVSVGRLTFPDSVNLLGREDDLLQYDVGIRLRMFENSMGRRVEYSIRVGRYRRQSTLPEFDISRNTFGFNAILGY